MAIPTTNYNLGFEPTVYGSRDVLKAEEALIQQRKDKRNGTKSSEGELTGKLVLGKIEDFMKVLMATVKHQDLDNPVKATEIAAQFNSFGQTLGMLEIKQFLEKMHKGSGTAQMLQAAAQVDRMVEVRASDFFYNPVAPCELLCDLPEGTMEANIIITDDKHRLISMFKQEAKPGRNSFRWDGKDMDGESVHSGHYLFRIQGIDSQGNLMRDIDGMDLETETSVRGVVQGGKLKDGLPYLNVSGQEYLLDSLIAIQGIGGGNGNSVLPDKGKTDGNDMQDHPNKDVQEDRPIMEEGRLRDRSGESYEQLE